MQINVFIIKEEFEDGIYVGLIVQVCFLWIKVLVRFFVFVFRYWTENKLYLWVYLNI